MAFNFEPARLEEFMVEARKGPYEAHGTRFIWIEVSGTLEIPLGLTARVEISVPVELDTDMAWSQIEAHAKAAARQLLINPQFQASLAG